MANKDNLFFAKYRDFCGVVRATNLVQAAADTLDDESEAGMSLQQALSTLGATTDSMGENITDPLESCVNCQDKICQVRELKS